MLEIVKSRLTMTSREAALEEENAKLLAEMASMKKKIVVHLKKQQAELQAKLQAAESRAAAAETALAASSNNANPISVDNEQVSKLKAELEEEKERNRKLEESTIAENKRLEAQIHQLKKVLDEESIKRDTKEELLKEELKNSQDIAQQRIGEFILKNEQLEAQLLAAAGQVSEAFTRIISTQDDMERISKESHETSRAHAKLIKEHERLSNELEKTRAALTRAEKDIEGKTKDIEEIAAARKVAQEGQNAAVDQLMQRLSEVEGGKLELVVQENKKLSEQLLESNTAVRKFQDHCTELQKCLLESEQGGSRSIHQQTDKNYVLDGSNIADAHDRELLVQVIYDLNFQNEYLKSQLQNFYAQTTESGNLEEYTERSKGTDAEIHLDALRDLEKQILVLNEQLAESRMLQATAENHMKQFQQACTESEQRFRDLSAQLAEVQEKMENEIKERDEKYMELDAKFVRLQKRAKQKIQELQKEKEDVEAQLSIASEKVSQAMVQQSMTLEELECTRRQAGEALQSLDGEKQQLRIANSRQKETLEELRRMLEAREHDIEELKQSLSEKDQMLQDTEVSLKVMDEKRQASLSDYATKHQKLVESFESQLADANLERSKAAEAISKLQEELADRESKLAELEAASTGEAVRLGVALDSAKGEVIRAKQEHQKEKESWEAALQTMKAKLEESENACLQYEIDAAKTRSQLELELAVLQQVLNGTKEELESSRGELSRLEDDFKAYKNRAHALLQKKDAELSAVKDMDLVAAQEAALKEAQREAALASTERDRALKALQDSVKNHETELATRVVALIDAEQRIKDMAMKLESTKAHLRSEQEAWQSTLSNVQETWRVKYEALEAQTNKTAITVSDEDLKSFRMNYEKLKEEHDSFREMANNIIEAKDNEISRLLDDNNNLQRSLRANHLVEKDHGSNQASVQQDSSVSVVAVAEQQILLLARQQAQREEELAQRQRHIEALQEEIAELEHENRLHHQQEVMLKSELRNMDRVQKRDGVDMTYLKNVILKLLETGEVEALLPVIGTLLQFSPEEIKKCQESYNAVPNVPLSGAAAVVDAAASGPRSFFSRFTL